MPVYKSLHGTQTLVNWQGSTWRGARDIPVSTLSASFNNFIRYVSPLSSFSRGGHHIYIVPRTRTRFGDRSFVVAGPQLWNSLPTSMRRNDTELDEFKPLMKTYLFVVADTAARRVQINLLHD